MSAFSSLKRLLFASLLVQNTLCVSVTVPVAAPSTAPKISQSLVSFSIEQDRWTDWAGTTSRNQFFFNTLDNLRQLTGIPPQIRIGADSEDRTNFNPNVQVSRLSVSFRHTSLHTNILVFSRRLSRSKHRNAISRSFNRSRWRWILPSCSISPAK